MIFFLIFFCYRYAICARIVRVILTRCIRRSNRFERVPTSRLQNVYGPHSYIHSSPLRRTHAVDMRLSIHNCFGRVQQTR